MAEAGSSKAAEPWPRPGKSNSLTDAAAGEEGHSDDEANNHRRRFHWFGANSQKRGANQHPPHLSVDVALADVDSDLVSPGTTNAGGGGGGGGSVQFSKFAEGSEMDSPRTAERKARGRLKSLLSRKQPSFRGPGAVQCFPWHVFSKGGDHPHLARCDSLDSQDALSAATELWRRNGSPAPGMVATLAGGSPHEINIYKLPERPTPEPEVLPWVLRQAAAAADEEEEEVEASAGMRRTLSLEALQQAQQQQQEKQQQMILAARAAGRPYPQSLAKSEVEKWVESSLQSATVTDSANADNMREPAGADVKVKAEDGAADGDEADEFLSAAGTLSRQSSLSLSGPLAPPAGATTAAAASPQQPTKQQQPQLPPTGPGRSSSGPSQASPGVEGSAAQGGKAGVADVALVQQVGDREVVITADVASVDGPASTSSALQQPNCHSSKPQQPAAAGLPPLHPLSPAASTSAKSPAAAQPQLSATGPGRPREAEVDAKSNQVAPAGSTTIGSAGPTISTNSSSGSSGSNKTPAASYRGSAALPPIPPSATSPAAAGATVLSPSSSSGSTAATKARGDGHAAGGSASGAAASEGSAARAAAAAARGGSPAVVTAGARAHARTSADRASPHTPASQSPHTPPQAPPAGGGGGGSPATLPVTRQQLGSRDRRRSLPRTPSSSSSGFHARKMSTDDSFLGLSSLSFTPPTISDTTPRGIDAVGLVPGEEGPQVWQRDEEVDQPQPQQAVNGEAGMLGGQGNGSGEGGGEGGGDILPPPGAPLGPVGPRRTLMRATSGGMDGLDGGSESVDEVAVALMLPRPGTLKRWTSLQTSKKGGAGRLFGGAGSESIVEESGETLAGSSSRRGARALPFLRHKSSKPITPRESVKRLLMWPRAGSQMTRCSSETFSLNAWSPVDPSTFHVRSPSYFTDRRKEPAFNAAVYEPWGVDVFHTTRKVHHIASHVELPTNETPPCGRDSLPPCLVVNLMIPLYSNLPLLQSEPDGPGISLVLYLRPSERFRTTAPPHMQQLIDILLPPQSLRRNLFSRSSCATADPLAVPAGGPAAAASASLAATAAAGGGAFGSVRADGDADGERDGQAGAMGVEGEAMLEDDEEGGEWSDLQEFGWDRLKIMSRVANESTANLGQTSRKLLDSCSGVPMLTRSHHRLFRGAGGEYIEMDVDLHTCPSSVRRGLQPFKRHLSDCIFDIAIVVQAESPEELPEPVLCCVRLHRLELSQFGSLASGL